MYDDDEKEGEEGHVGHWHHMGGPIRKEFKLAMLEKKEKILNAKLEFVVKMKTLVAKMPTEKR